ncbi:hypothetical protein PAPHI01_1313 [Pancytospora philotis]|nr:hypothetical protein PAPHI01_1313 [Pancytospora philotis]
MDTPKKIVGYIRESLSNLSSILAPGSPDIEARAVECPGALCDPNDTVVLKRVEYESMQDELQEQSQTIKRLKGREEASLSQIQEYEAMFTEVLKKEIGRKSDAGDCDASFEKVKCEGEIERLRASEERLKSHIRALEKDLVDSEAKAEATSEELCDRISALESRVGEALSRLQSMHAASEGLCAENQSLKAELKKKCEQLAELLGYCEHLAH